MAHYLATLYVSLSPVARDGCDERDTQNAATHYGQTTTQRETKNFETNVAHTYTPSTKHNRKLNRYIGE